MKFKVSLDKQAHALSGAILVLLPVITSRPLWWGLLICLGAALAKEVYDLRHPDHHTCDFWDAIATISGGAVAAIYVIGVNL